MEVQNVRPPIINTCVRRSKRGMVVGLGTRGLFFVSLYFRLGLSVTVIGNH